MSENSSYDVHIINSTIEMQVRSTLASETRTFVYQKTSDY